MLEVMRSFTARLECVSADHCRIGLQDVLTIDEHGNLCIVKYGSMFEAIQRYRGR
jgi:hypothetical protein